MLVIEAGVFHTAFLLDVPVFTPALFGTEFDWDYLTQSQDQACLALNNKQSRWPRGKIYGGTHILNNMIHHRGFPDDYRGWFNADTSSYDYDLNVMPYFQKSEEWMELSKPAFNTPMSQVFIESGNELFVDRQFRKPTLNQRNGRRWTTSHSNFYFRRRKGHKILTNALVTKVLFDSTSKKAVGVEYRSNDITGRVFATKGVILSAGTIETPKLLMLSGIGPRNDLETLGIQVVRDLPVGQNLQDHITTGLDLVLLNRTLPTTPLKLMSLQNIYDYYFHGTGPLTHGGCDGMGFVRTNPMDNRTVPDISFLLMPMGVSTDIGLRFRRAINLRNDVWTSYFGKFAGHSVASIIPVLLHPRSRGTIRLRSSDPLVKPAIDPNYLADPHDVRTLVTSLRMLKTLIEMPQMRDFGAEFNPIPLPACRGHEVNSNSYWECYVRQLTFTMYHPVGTCRMGDPHDKLTVVDFGFRVHGIENLYVVDASVMPNLSSGNPNGVVAMLATRFLDLID